MILMTLEGLGEFSQKLHQAEKDELRLSFVVSLLKMQLFNNLRGHMVENWLF